MRNKNILLIVVGIMLSTFIAGCSVASKGIETASAIHEKKAELCSKLSPALKELGVALINSKVEAYPDEGLCDPDALAKELNKRLEAIEPAQ